MSERDSVLQDALCVDNNKLVTIYLEDVKNTLFISELSTGKLIQQLPLDIGSIDSIAGRKEDSEMFFKFSSFLNPGILYRYDFSTSSTSVFRETQLKAEGFKTSDFQTKQVFYPSKDGTKIPMFIISRKVLIF